jgi:acetyl-CoA carboxylase biotin carboxyl carrier protein
MDHDKLNRLLQLLEGTSVTELEYAADGWKMRIARGLQSSNRAASTKVSEVASSGGAAKIIEHVLQPQHVITAGLTGTFYRASAPDQTPFVSVGDTVRKGQTVGVVEAMKMLNMIEADCAGRVVNIFANDGATVLPDSKLFAIEPLEVSHV